jgi:DNA-binding MarR family transcriptional regulator
VSGDLSFDLHRLTARLDRSADAILQAEAGLTYRRFLALLIVGELGRATQRALAEALDVSEPSVSRMVGVLEEAGLVEVGPAPGGGNKRQVALTSDGTHAVGRCRALLEQRFAGLVALSGVDYTRYAQDTRRLIEAFDEKETTP